MTQEPILATPKTKEKAGHWRRVIFTLLFGAAVTLTPALVLGQQPVGGDKKQGEQSVELAGVEPADLRANADEGYRLRDYPVNDLFQFLAREAGKQYFQNPSLNGLTISGHMMSGDPIRRMQEVAFQYGISLYEKGNTVYAIPAGEVANMPRRQAEFSLRYLRPDEAKLKVLLAPFLTPGTGSVEYEDKTNTLVVHDNEPAISRIREFLGRVDVPRKQVTVQVRIFRVTIESGREFGVSWEQTLGRSGLNISGTARMALEETFGVNITKDIINNFAQLLDTAKTPAETIEAEFRDNTEDRSTQESSFTRNLTLNDIGLTAVLRALYENADSEQESAPTIITEDNETAVFSHLDKIPIVTVTTSVGTGPTVDAPEVRYQPDPEDPFDIGLKLSVKPTVLPDNNIRLKITPSVGTITGFQKAGQYEYPKVLLAEIDNIATVPNGHTLVFGGFTQYSNIQGADKVPILGDIPLVNFFFSSKSNRKIRTNLVFFVTATATNSRNKEVAVAESDRVRKSLIADPSVRWADDDRVGSTTDADLATAIKNDVSPFADRRGSDNPISHINPSNQDVLRSRGFDVEERGRVPRPWEGIIPPRKQP